MAVWTSLLMVRGCASSSPSPDLAVGMRAYGRLCDRSEGGIAAGMDVYGGVDVMCLCALNVVGLGRSEVDRWGRQSAREVQVLGMGTNQGDEATPDAACSLSS